MTGDAMLLSNEWQDKSLRGHGMTRNDTDRHGFGLSLRPHSARLVICTLS